MPKLGFSDGLGGGKASVKLEPRLVERRSCKG